MSSEISFKVTHVPGFEWGLTEQRLKSAIMYHRDQELLKEEYPS